MKIAFVGDVSKDFNVVKGKEIVAPGGGVFYGAIAAQKLGAEAWCYTKCAKEDEALFADVPKAGVRTIFLPSATSTSIRNVYPSDNPDDRTSTNVSKAEPFSPADVDRITADCIHINPLWMGLIAPELIWVARRRAPLLAGDAQGFLRVIQPDGQMKNTDWAEKRKWLHLFDVFKVDSKEAKILTGLDEPKAAAAKVREFGPRIVLLTHQGGVCVYNGRAHYEAPWSGFTLEGRTGRGDTCTASFLVALLKDQPLQEAAAFAAKVTSAKMQYKGPYRG